MLAEAHQVADEFGIAVVRVCGMHQALHLHDVIALAEQQAVHLIADDREGINVIVDLLIEYTAAIVKHLQGSGEEGEACGVREGRDVLSCCNA